MTKVYIIHDTGRKNFLPAEKHGELVTLIDGYVNHTQLPRYARNLSAQLGKSITKNDWLVAAGNPALTALAGQIMGQKTGIIRMLLWDNQLRDYAKVEIPAWT